MIRGGASAYEIHLAQLRLQAGEDLPPGAAADMARKIAEFVTWAKARTFVDPPQTADGS
jgi:hypothetical protein